MAVSGSMHISEPTAKDDGYAHFDVSTEGVVVDVCLNPRGIYAANESEVGEQAALEATNAVSDWTIENDDQTRRLFAIAGRLFRSKEPRLRDRPVPRLPILSATPRNGGIDAVVRVGSTDVRYHVSSMATMIERDDEVVDLLQSGELTLEQLDAAIESVARYLVEDDRLFELGGDATLKQLLQDFWVFEARALDPSDEVT